MANARDTAVYGVTLERGRDGSYLAWVDDLPGCAVRGRSRDEVLARLPEAIAGFVTWTGARVVGAPAVTVTDEVETAVEADEDTEVLVSADGAPLTEEVWKELRTWLARSRAELDVLLERLTDGELAEARHGSERTRREEIEHVGFVELMYAAWTFDLHSREGLAEFLAWTRKVATERLDELARTESAEQTWALWGGAPRPEPWTARKAARRLVWHELLHLRALERSSEDGTAAARGRDRPGNGGVEAR